MVSTLSIAFLALSATTALAHPKAHRANYAHHRFHGSAMTGNGYANPSGTMTRHHHNGTRYGACKGSNHTETTTSTSTLYVTVTAYPTSNTTTTTTTEILTTTTTTEEVVVTTPAAASTTASEAPTSVTVDAILYSPTTEAATSAAAAFYSQSQAPAASTSSAAVSTYNNGPKGLSYNDASSLSLFSNSGSTWAYNWQADASGTLPQGMEYVPMCWGKWDDGSIAQCPADLQSAISTHGSTHILSFNEPDNSGQSNMTPQLAFQYHNKYIFPFQGKVKIGSPATTSTQGTANVGLDWMGQFLALCKPDGQADQCGIDFLPLHWYGGYDQLDNFQMYVGQGIALAQKYGIQKVWVTEFAAKTGSDSDKASFLKQAMSWMQGQPAIERYAYFMVGYKSDENIGMVLNSALNAVGQVYDTTS